MPKALWMKVRDIVYEAVIKIIPNKKKCKEAKQLFEENLKIFEKRRKAKEKIYPLLQSSKEQQGDIRKPSSVISAKKERKTTDQRKGQRKTRGLFKKIRDTRGLFHAKMGTIRDRNCMDLTEAEDIKKRWQEYTEELYKKRY